MTDLIFYTYAYLRDDGTPYYIGKGHGDRAYNQCGRNVKVPPRDRVLFLKKNLTEEKAFEHEIYMIAILGRKDLGTGILRNLTNGGEGVSGYIYTSDHKQKLSQASKDQVWWNNGQTQTKVKECPGEGWELGPLPYGLWWNDGKTNTRSKKCPGEGWELGRLSRGPWWNNGEIEKQSKKCPGPEWVKGRITKKK